MTQRRKVLLALCAALALSTAAQAQTTPFPSRPITIVVPFPPGGITDQIARVLAQKLQDQFGKPVIVDNKPGGGGQIAAAQLRHAEPDGHTLLIGATEMFAINPGLYRKFSYDPVKDFEPVASLISSPLVLVVPANSPAKSLSDLVSQSKSKTGGLNFASQGIGSVGHLLGEQFRTKSGAVLAHVAYKGSSPALQDVMGGQVDMMFDPVITTAPLLASGKLRALGVASPQRVDQLPNVKTLAEQGVTNVDAAVWFGAVVKSGTPAPVVDRLNQALVAALHDPAVVKRFTDQGLSPIPSTPQKFGAFMRSEISRWGALVKSSGATVD